MELFTTLQSALVNQIKAAGSIPVYINVMISMMPLGGGTHSAGLDLVDPVDSSHRACLPLPGQTPSTHQPISLIIFFFSPLLYKRSIIHLLQASEHNHKELLYLRAESRS